MYLTALIFGALGASFALILELVLLDLSAFRNYASFAPDFASLGILACAALIEEAAKYLFLRQYLLRFFASQDLGTALALTLGALFGVGFASLEIGLALAETPERSILPWLFGTALLHLSTSLIVISFLKQEKNRVFRSFFFPLSLAFGLHLLYNIWVAFGA